MMVSLLTDLRLLGNISRARHTKRRIEQHYGHIQPASVATA